jgi:endo-1,4-beta-xylanase
MDMPNNLNRREALLSVAGVAPLWAAAADVTLTCRAFDPAGKPAASRQLETLLTWDMNGRPFELVPKITGDGTLTIPRPNRPFEIFMRLPVRDFGEVYLYASDVRGPEVLLNYEFARSRAAFVRRYVTAAQKESVSFSAAMMKRLEAGEAALKQATAASDTPTRVRLSNDSLAETMWAGEMAALERARDRIRRQGRRPGFLFGCNSFGYARGEEYAKRFTDLLNFGTVPFYRGTTEPAEGKYDYSRVDRILEKSINSSLLIKGHPLLWLNKASLTDYLRKMNFGQFRESTRGFILNTVGKYRSRIHAWDIINEAHDWANEMRYSGDQCVELTRMASQATRVADPTAFRVVNTCCIWADYVATRLSNMGTLDRPSRTVFEYLNSLQDAKVDYDGLGLQIYCPGRDMLEIERHIERFFVFNKPIHITELGIPSANNKDTLSTYEERQRRIPYPIDAVWHGTEWTEQAQADWAEQFYTICYSKPQVEAITWWDFTDPGYMPNGGFLTRDLKPKQSYERLAKLFESWRA